MRKLVDELKAICDSMVEVGIMGYALLGLVIILMIAISPLILLGVLTTSIVAHIYERVDFHEDQKQYKEEYFQKPPDKSLDFAFVDAVLLANNGSITITKEHMRDGSGSAVTRVDNPDGSITLSHSRLKAAHADIG